MEKYVNKYFRTCLKDSHRKSMSKENPLPDSPALRCPKADDAVKDIMGKAFPKKMDDSYKRIQSSVNAPAAPALSLWKDLGNQGFPSGGSDLMPVQSTLDMIQRTLVLLGNSSNYLSQCRRDSIISKIKQDKETELWLGDSLG